MNSPKYRIVQTYSVKLTGSDVDKSIDIQVMRPLEAERSQFEVGPGHSIQDVHKACHITSSSFYAYPSYEVLNKHRVGYPEPSACTLLTPWLNLG